MTAKTFIHDLRRGLGSAIVELNENPDKNKYRDLVLRCCLKDISYDIQSEGTKGYYLYTAICALGVKDEFENILIYAFMERLEYRLFEQLVDILCLYANDGSQKARDALHAKYQDLTERLSKQNTFPFKYCEREQFEYLMICDVDAYKWPVFKKCIADAGRIIVKRRDDACNYYDWFICHCENIFGKKRVALYFKNAPEKSKEVNAFITAMNKLEKLREENSRLRVEPEVNLESYIARAKELEKEQYAFARMRIAAMRFSGQGNKDELTELVSIIINERSDEVRANLLRVFRYIDFPADIDLLMKYTESDCERLQDITIGALERFTDRRVHELSYKLITAGNIEAGFPLLINNWRKQDDALIRKYVLSSKKVSHSTQQNLRDIYARHRSKSCVDILEHAYYNGECTYCRSGIVDAMWKSRVLTKRILNECLYDSYDETRKTARRIKKTMGL